MERSNRRWRRIVIPFLLLLAWIGVSWLGVVDEVILPRPESVLLALGRLITTKTFLNDLGVSLFRVGVAVFAAALLGIPIGLYLGYRRRAYEYVEGTIHAFRSVPASALFPLLLIFVGVGNTAIIVLAAYPSFLVLLVNVASGARLANPRRMYHADILGLTPWEKITEVLFFEALPQVFDGLRTSVSYSLVLVVAVEMFIGAGDGGLGRRIYESQSAYLIPETYAAIIVAGVIGISLNAMLSVCERRALRWIPHAQEEIVAS